MLTCYTMPVETAFSVHVCVCVRARARARVCFTVLSLLYFDELEYYSVGTAALHNYTVVPLDILHFLRQRFGLQYTTRVVIVSILVDIIILHVLCINYIIPVYNDEITYAFSPTYFLPDTFCWNYIGI